jgi:5-formyltetrahydrofolate cyclo-ligase
MINEEKKSLRRALLDKRSSLSFETRRKKDTLLSALLAKSEAFLSCDTLLAYSPIKDEIDVSPLVEKAISMGKRVAFPKCNVGGKMDFYYVNSLSELSIGAYNIKEPKENCELFIGRERTICILPALAFDKKGYRLGYGGGYYDRFLERFALTRIGLVYDEFLFDNLPKNEHDKKADILITEGGVILLENE